jgi:YggT family protein
MVLLYNLVSALGHFFDFVELLIIIDALSTWFMPSRSNKISRAIGVVIDPIVTPFQHLQRKLFPNSPIDFSPMLAILFLEFLKGIVFRLI